MGSIEEIAAFMKSNIHIVFILAIIYFAYSQLPGKGRGKMSGG